MRDDVYNKTVDDIVAAHNAELAAERERANKNEEDKAVVMHSYSVLQENERLKQQLAAEREKAEALAEALRDIIRMDGLNPIWTPTRIAQAALAKVKEEK